MAFGQRQRRVVTDKMTPSPHADSPTSLVAAAARINLSGQKTWLNYRFGDNTWQEECWRLYDVIGELRFAASWVGSCCSRVRIYVAEVDKNGRVQQETKKPKIAALADTCLLYTSDAADERSSVDL